MKKTLLLLCLSLAFTNVFSQNHEKLVKESQAIWDFDHSLQYKQTLMDNQHYEIIVIRNNKSSFSQMSAFLIRKSYELCKNYEFSIEFNYGIEKFDDKKVKSQIKDSLSADIFCSG